MFVARVIAKLEPGGAQLSMLRVMRELRGHGIASSLYCGWATPAGIELARRHGAEPEIWGEGGNLQWVPEPRFAAWLGPRLAAADLVHAHMFGAWWAAARAAPAGTPLVASEHNQYLWPGRPRSAEMREALGRVDVFFAHGPGARATVIAHGLAPERVREGISPVVGTRARAAPGLPSPRIVFAGRLDPDKGPDILVEALGLLRDPPADADPRRRAPARSPAAPRPRARPREAGELSRLGAAIPARTSPAPPCSRSRRATRPSRRPRSSAWPTACP